MATRPQDLSLLSSQLLTIETGAGRERLTLPQLLSCLLLEPLPQLNFPHSTAVQRSHWWRFLVRTAAHVHHVLGHATPAALSPEVVSQVLVESTRGEDAWLIAHTDYTRPAFLQPPAPDGMDAPQNYLHTTISYLSSAIGSKNHERKVDATPALSAEQVVYALLELQGGAIFGGRGNYGSQLMGSASGKGSGTPFMGVMLPSGLGTTFRHDLSVLLSSWDDLEQTTGLGGPVWALWAEEWDGLTQIPAVRLTPAFIPMARAVRLELPDADGMFRTVLYRTSEVYRVHDHTPGGDLGDPFLPKIRTDDGWKIRGVVASSPARPAFDYREVAAFFTDPERQPSPTVRAFADMPSEVGDTPALLILEGLAFEQGKTLGFHRRVVPLYGRDIPFLADAEPLRQAHDFMMAKTSEASMALRGAVRILLRGEPKPRKGDEGPLNRASTPFTHLVDAHYLRVLFEGARQEQADRTDYQREWVEQLAVWTRSCLSAAENGLPRTESLRYKRSVEAEGYLSRRLRQMLAEVVGQAREQPA